MKKTILVMGLALILFTGCGQKKVESEKSSSSYSVTSQNKQQELSSSKSSDKLSSSMTSSDKNSSVSTSSMEDSSVSVDSEKSLDTDAITKGDFSSLVGTWENSEGKRLDIKSDGTVNENMKVEIDTIGQSDTSIPTVSVQPKKPAAGGFLLFLFEKDVENPKGDNSDVSKDRIVGSQNSIGPFQSDAYYYRVSI
ncbi:TPA: hypothetical protein OTY93_001281 [Enterococcus faecalis]|nr:hypothetical protein [Enterococcus faecalis]HCT4863272.1 hypothetical protein [Enterococcus faecalis]